MKVTDRGFYFVNKLNQLPYLLRNKYNKGKKLNESAYSDIFLKINGTDLVLLPAREVTALLVLKLHALI